jgi:hypothetical protein
LELRLTVASDFGMAAATNEAGTALLAAAAQLFLASGGGASVGGGEKLPAAKFTAFVRNFVALMQWKRSGVQTRLQRLRAGVDKLTETRNF